jgi:hypothetical protein
MSTITCSRMCSQELQRLLRQVGLVHDPQPFAFPVLHWALAQNPTVLVVKNPMPFSYPVLHSAFGENPTVLCDLGRLRSLFGVT